MDAQRVIRVIRFVTIVSATLCGCASRRSEPVKQAEFSNVTRDVASGERMFMTWCQKCHPAAGAGLGPSLNASPAPQFINRFQVRHGLGAMPQFKKEVISRSDLHDISAFLRAWKSY